MFVWNEETVHFLRNASEYGDYYRQLAAWIAPHLNGNEHLCDAGCGLGYLSLELSKYVKCITAVDSSEIALNLLRRNAANRRNITIQCGKIESFTPPVLYDAMVFCFFGKMDEVASIAKAQCRGEIFVFKKNYVNHRFTPGEYPVGDDSFENAVGWLEGRGVPFTSDALSLEMGQPLRSREEARRFFNLYHRGGEITDDFLDSRLIATGREDFPLYLPQKREIGCLRMQVSDLPTQTEESL